MRAAAPPGEDRKESGLESGERSNLGEGEGIARILGGFRGAELQELRGRKGRSGSCWNQGR